MVTRNSPAARIALAAGLVVLALVLVPAALAGKPGGGGGHGGGGGGGSCAQKSPGVYVDNTYAWAQYGSWGLPGQQLMYAIDVIDYDVGCASSTFAVSVSAPGGFSVSIPTSTISLKAGGSGYVWAYVTSPTAIADGDYPITVSVTRSGGSASATSFYKVFSSDSTAPTLFWPNPGDGLTITGRSYNVTVSSSDDHAVRKIDVSIDGVLKSETSCDGVAYSCSLYYAWSPQSGKHTATFRSYDWLGNVGFLTVSFTVG